MTKKVYFHQKIIGAIALIFIAALFASAIYRSYLVRKLLAHEYDKRPHDELESAKQTGRFVVSPPPRFHYQLFQHTSPLVSFDDSTLTGKPVTGNGGDINDLEDSLDSVDFLKEIQTFGLEQDEDPDINEQDDAQFLKTQEIFEWLSSDELAKGNGKMQRKIKGYFKAPEAFIKDFEPIMRESQSKSRSSQTMRNAAAGYYAFRPVSDFSLNKEERFNRPAQM